MEELVIETPEGVVLSMDIAGAGSRSAAALIDVGVLALVVLGGLLALQALGGGSRGLLQVLAGGALLFLALYQLLFALLGISTPGKNWLGLEVVSETGEPADLVQHLLRGLFWPIEAFLFVPVPFGMVLMASTPRHQRLGDLVAGTLVVRRVRPSSSAEPLPRARWEALENPRLALVPALAVRFDGEDLEILAELVGRRGIDGEVRGRLLLDGARHFLGRLDRPLPSSLTPREAHGLLSELYLFLRDGRRHAGQGVLRGRGSDSAASPSRS